VKFDGEILYTVRKLRAGRKFVLNLADVAPLSYHFSIHDHCIYKPPPLPSAE
jgi:hypothetical protein